MAGCWPFAVLPTAGDSFDRPPRGLMRVGLRLEGAGADISVMAGWSDRGGGGEGGGGGGSCVGLRRESRRQLWSLVVGVA